MRRPHPATPLTVAHAIIDPMNLNPYVVARTIRAIFAVLLAGMLPFLVVGFIPLAMAGPRPLFTYFGIIALLIIGIAVASVFCTKYQALKPAPNKRAERVYGVIGISLILLVFLVIVLVPILSSVR